MLHLLLHVLVPLTVAGVVFRKRPELVWRAFGLMLLGMLIDIDHLLATPIYDPGRCSIGFHPLHTTLPIVLYSALLAHPKSRILGVGLCIHIVLDAMDCYGVP